MRGEEEEWEGWEEEKNRRGWEQKMNIGMRGREEESINNLIQVPTSIE